MQVQPPAVPADGVTYSTVSVRSNSGDGGLLPSNIKLLLASSGSADIQQFGAPDADGLYTAKISSRQVGLQDLTVLASNGSQTTALPVSGIVTFNSVAPPPPGAPSALTSWLAAVPNVAADDGQATTLLTLHVVDSNNIPVPAVAVTFTCTGSHNFFSIDSGITDIDGVLTTTLASTVAETKTVAAHTPGMAVTTQVTFSPLGASSLFSTLQVNPNTLTADGTSTTALTSTLRDTAGLPLEGAPVTWTTTGTNNTLVPGVLVTDANGVATATLSSTAAQTENVTVSSGTFNVSQPVTFLPGAINSSTSTFVANPNLLTADNTSTAVLTFTARDALGNGVPNVPVVLSSTGSNNTLSPLSGNTDGAGVFTATWASGKAETKTVTATSGSIVLNQSVTFLAGQPNTTLSSLTANPTSPTADGVSTTTLTLTLKDGQGNPASGQAMTFSSSGSTNTFSQAIGTTDATGTYTTTLSSTTAEDKIVIASFAGGSVSADVTFVNGAASSSMTSLTASPSTVIANGSSATVLTVTVRDAFGNPVPLQAVSLVSTGSNNSLNPPSGTTDTTGMFSATLASTTAEVKAVTATAGGATASASVTFVAGAPSGTTTTFNANPASLTADGTSQSTLTVTVNDINGNPIANQSVTFSSTGSNNTIAAPSGSTNASGVFVTTIASTKAEVKSVTATIGSVVKTNAVTFVAGAPASSTTTLVANPNAVAANGTGTTTLTVSVHDAQGNPVPGQSVSLSSSGSNNTFGNPTGTTDSSGAYSTTLTSTTAEVKTVTATVGSVNATTTVTFTAGAPASATSTLSANPTSATADGVSTTQLTFVVKDAFGNGVPHQAVTFSSSGSNNTFTPVSGNTDSTGTLVATLASTKAEVKTVTGAAGAATASTHVTFVAGTVSTTTTTLVANPNTAAADGSSAITLVATALDAHGNPVAAQSVAMSASGPNNTFATPTGSTNSSGTFTTTLTSITAQTEAISALVAGTVTANTNVVFTAPVVSPTNSTILASPNALTADGTTTTTITVTVLNGVGAPVIGASVAMSASGTNNTFAPVSGTTDSSGMFTTTLASTQSGAKTVTATVDGTALNTTVTFLPGTPSSTTSTLVANPNTVTADGTSTSTLTVVVLDSHGNPEPNQTVALAVSGGNNTMTPASGNTDATGTFTATLASTLAQTESVTATVNGTFTKTASVTFVHGTVSGTTTTFVASPNSTTADGASTIAFTATVKDAEGNPVPSQLVSLSSTGSNNAFTPVSGSTNSAGVFTATMTSTKAEWKNVTATLGTVNENANVLFVAGAVSGTTSMLVLNPTSVTANGNTSAVTVTVLDGQGNPVANQSVTLSGSGTANTFTLSAGNTNPNGVFTATLSSTVAQTETITAAVGSVHLTAAMTFTPGAASSVTSSLNASPTTLVADGTTTTTLTVTVKDAQGNAVPSQAVSLSSTGTSNTITPVSGTTGATGLFTATFASTTAGVKVVTATMGGFTETASVTFTAGAPSGTTTTFVASPTIVTADGASTSTLTVTVQDVHGNAVSNQGVTFSSSGSNNTLSPVSGSTNASGVFTATLASTKAESKTVTATVGSLAPTAAVTFTAGAPSSTTSSVSAVPGLVTADGTSTSTVTVTVLDAFGNPVPSQSVSVGASGSANLWGATSGSTDASGVWSTTLASTLAQTETITATIGSMTKTTSVTFAVGAPSNTTSSLTATPSSLMANGTSLSTLQVTVKDGTSNPINAQAVTFSPSGSGYTLSSSTCSTNASGVCSVTLASTVAQTMSVTANFAGLAQTAAVTFVVGAPSGTTSSLTASPTSLPDDGASTSTLQVTVEDAHGNLINAQAVTFSSTGTGVAFSSTTCSTNTSGVCSVTAKSSVAQVITVTASFAGVNSTAALTFAPGSPSNATSSLSASPTSLPDDGVSTSTLQVSVEDATGNPLNAQAVTFSSNGTGTTFSATTCSTNASGICSVTLRDSKAETVTVTATFAGLSKTAAVTYTLGPASSSTSFLTASPNSLADDGVATSTVQITVEDATGNPINGQAVTFSNNGTGVNQSAPTCTTASGVCSITVDSAKAQAITMTANFAGLSKTASVTFVLGVPNSSASTLTASPNTLADDGVATTTLLVTVEDLTSNPINAQAVTFTSTGAGYTFSATTCNTNTSGQCSVTLKSTVAETVKVTAAFAGISENANVTFTLGAPTNANSTFVASPTTQIANGSSTIGLTVTVKDGTGNVISNQPVTFSGSGTSNTFSATTGTTNTSGVFSATLSSPVEQVETITASFASVTFTASVTFAAGSPNTTTSTLVINPNSLTANGSSTTTITVTLRDAQNNLISGQAVTFAANGTGNTLAPSTSSTVGGVATATLNSTVAQTKTITVTFAGTQLTGTVTFVPGPPSVTNSALTLSPNNVDIRCTTPGALTLTLRDAQNNLISGYPATFSSAAGVTITPSTGSTSAGVLAATVTSSSAQSANVVATFGGNSLSVGTTFYAGSPNATQSTVSISPSSGISADGTSAGALTATLRDALGCPLGNYPMVISTSGTAIGPVSLDTNTNSSGVTTYNVTSIFGGSKTVTVRSGAMVINTSVSFTSRAAYCPTTAFYPQPPMYEAFSTGSSDPAPVAVADINRDGYMDVLTTSENTNTITLSLGQGTGDFNNYTSFTMDVFPYDVAVCDLNGDSNTDVVAISETTGNASYMLGKGNGTFGAVTSVNLCGTPLRRIAVACMDVTGDTFADIIATCDTSIAQSSVTVLPGRGNGTFKPTINSLLNNGPWNATLADINGDGKPDYVFADNVSSVWVCLNNGTGSFAAGTQYAGGNGTNYAMIANFNHDAYMDVAVSAWNSGVTVLLGTGGGNLAAGTLVSSVTMPNWMAATDFNKDGNMDIAVGYGGNTVGVMLGKGNGTTFVQTQYLAGLSTYALSANDINGDGNTDIVATNSVDNTFGALLNYGNGTFTSPKSFATDTGPSELINADITGDGYTDIVVTTGGNNTVSVLPGTGTATLGTAASYSVGGQPSFAGAADFNQDGNLDLALSMQNGGVAVLLNKGHGIMGTPTLYTGGSNNWGVGLGDFNGDGNIDIATGDRNANTVWVFMSKGGGTFQAGVSYTAGATGSNPAQLVVSDLNLDGYQDLILPLFGTQQLAVLHGTSTGTFQNANLYADTGSCDGAAVADFNLDGYLDVAVSISGGGTAGAAIDIFMGAATGSLTLTTTYLAPGELYDVYVSDLNGDGIPDLMAPAFSLAEACLSLGKGDGTFQQMQYYAVGNQAYGMTAADFNGDGKMDIAASAQGLNTVVMMPYTTCP